MSQPTPFKVSVPDHKLASIRERVARFQWFPEPDGVPEWGLGISSSFLKDLQAYWLDDYDWRNAEAELNRYPNYIVNLGGLDIHFLHIIGEAAGKRPLLLTHGWPGSVYEFYGAIDALAYPSRHGGFVHDAFDLIIPSLPGYGFSGKPKSLLGPRRTAKLWDTLMRDVLGYNAYLAQGGDWGAVVTSWLGYEHGLETGGGGCQAIHLNMVGLRPSPAEPQTQDEAKWLQTMQSAMQSEGSYLMQQSTKPQTLAMALMDSPMGTAAWVLEKFHGWSDLRGGQLLDIYSRDQLLTNVMIYLVNDAIATSVRYYASFFAEGGQSLPAGKRCETPTGFANFPGDRVYSAPPQSWLKRAYNLTHYSDMPQGGHFAAMEVPDIFTHEVRGWARSLA